MEIQVVCLIEFDLSQHLRIILTRSTPITLSAENEASGEG